MVILLVAQTVKSLLAMREEMQVRSLCWENPLEKAMQPTPVFLLGEIHGQKSLAGYSPWDHRVRHDRATNTHTEWLDLPGKIYGAR